MNCESCAFWHMLSVPNAFGSCKRNAPVLMVVPQKTSTGPRLDDMTRWPTTHRMEACGDYVRQGHR